MKKYRVTEKHQLFKEGLTIHFNETFGHYDVYTDGKVFYKDVDIDISSDIRHGWIEEIQELEFTKDDLAIFALYFCNDTDNDTTMDEALNNWIKKYKK